jgi:copper(I)-binding protein
MSLRLLVAGTTALSALSLWPASGIAKPTPATTAVLTVSDGYVAEAPPTAKVMAAFMTLSQSGSKPLTVTGASSPQFAQLAFHETLQEGGMARMVVLKTLTIPVGGSVTLAPGGKHMMLFHPKRALKAGDTVSVTFRFDQGRPTQTVTLSVRSGHGSAHEHGHQEHPHGGHDHRH